tara:strand:+ start:192 stop:656 length:465 start_codon:yes stop_codon:yes gene_type:complete
MKKWNFKVKSDPKEIGKKLESSLGEANRFVLSLDKEKINSINFKIRKRMLLAFEINTQNNIIVNGTISKASHNNTNVEVSFSQHPLAKLLMYGHIVLGLGFLAGIILKLGNNSVMLLVGLLLIAIGILLAIHLKKSFDKNVQEYKKLIAEIVTP